MLPYNARPLYCTLMRHLVLCFTGFKVKEDLVGRNHGNWTCLRQANEIVASFLTCFPSSLLPQSRMAELVHHMGGSIRKDFSSRVTHLVANCTGGEKYRVSGLFQKLFVIFSKKCKEIQLRKAFEFTVDPLNLPIIFLPQLLSLGGSQYGYLYHDRGLGLQVVGSQRGRWSLVYRGSTGECHCLICIYVNVTTPTVPDWDGLRLNHSDMVSW